MSLATLTERQWQMLWEIRDAGTRIYPATARWDVQALAAEGLVRARPALLLDEPEQRYVAQAIEETASADFAYYELRDEAAR